MIEEDFVMNNIERWLIDDRFVVQEVVTNTSTETVMLHGKPIPETVSLTIVLKGIKSEI